MDPIPVVAVVGPTATGKTHLAVELALRFGGEVVSADSMQIYKGLSIGTAKPTREEMRGIPHHLVGFLDPEEPFSVADYVRLASEAVREISARGKLPIVAGGTGLYVSALLSGVAFPPEKGDAALREDLRAKAEKDGPEALWEELRSFDPESAARIHPNNIDRVIRAIEVYRLSGVTMAERQRRSREIPPPFESVSIGLSFRNRAKLYEAIDRRVERMMEAGLVREAETVFHLPHTATAAQAIGYKEFFPCFCGEGTLADAEAEVKRESRRYAKRQLTWFRREPGVNWIFVDECSGAAEVAERACDILEEKRRKQ